MPQYYLHSSEVSKTTGGARTTERLVCRKAKSSYLHSSLQVVLCHPIDIEESSSCLNTTPVVVLVLILPASPISSTMHASLLSVDTRSAANVITITPSIDVSFLAGANP